jgi:hypothetical protein
MLQCESHPKTSQLKNAAYLYASCPFFWVSVRTNVSAPKLLKRGSLKRIVGNKLLPFYNETLDDVH